MLQPELLIRKVIQTLEAAGIEYMLTGSVVSSLQGEPRSTHDIDLVVALPKSAVASLVEAFPSPDFYLSEDSILDAIENQSMFNIIDVAGSDRVDFWILTDEPFDQSRFSRKYVEEIGEVRIQVSSLKIPFWQSYVGRSFLVEVKGSLEMPCASMKCNLRRLTKVIWHLGQKR